MAENGNRGSIRKRGLRVRAEEGMSVTTLKVPEASPRKHGRMSFSERSSD
jgi:hypothetical protein